MFKRFLRGFLGAKDILKIVKLVINKFEYIIVIVFYIIKYKIDMKFLICFFFYTFIL